MFLRGNLASSKVFCPYSRAVRVRSYTHSLYSSKLFVRITIRKTKYKMMTRWNHDFLLPASFFGTKLHYYSLILFRLIILRLFISLSLLFYTHIFNSLSHKLSLYLTPNVFVSFRFIQDVLFLIFLLSNFHTKVKNWTQYNVQPVLHVSNRLRVRPLTFSWRG